VNQSVSRCELLTAEAITLFGATCPSNIIQHRPGSVLHLREMIDPLKVVAACLSARIASFLRPYLLQFRR
jgi:hypothetical protein